MSSKKKHASTPADFGLAHSGGGENGPATPDLREKPLHEDIAACARDLWRKYGCPVGRDEEIWLEAERQLLGADPAVARVGGPSSADKLNQTAPASTAGPGRRELAVSSAPASSGLRDY